MSNIGRPPQVNIRMPSEVREGLRCIANTQDRSMNYVIVRALKEYIARNSEAPTVGAVRASNLSNPRKEFRHDKYSN